MTDPLTGVVIPYSRFLECRERRQRIAAELTPPDQPPASDADALPAAAVVASAQPLTAK
jgi:hypothetical protein